MSTTAPTREETFWAEKFSVKAASLPAAIDLCSVKLNETLGQHGSESMEFAEICASKAMLCVRMAEQCEFFSAKRTWYARALEAQDDGFMAIGKQYRDQNCDLHSFAVYMHNLAALLNFAGRYYEAVRTYTEYLQLLKDNDRQSYANEATLIWYTMLQILEKQSKHQEARALLLEALAEQQQAEVAFVQRDNIDLQEHLNRIMSFTKPSDAEKDAARLASAGCGLE